MFKIETVTKSVEGPYGKRDEVRNFLAENETVIPDVQAFDWLNDGRFEIHSETEEASRMLAEYKIEDFSNIASSLNLNGIRRLDEFDFGIGIQFREADKLDSDEPPIFPSQIPHQQGYNLRFSILTRLGFWNHSYSFSEFREEFLVNLLEVLGDLEYLVEDDEHDDYDPHAIVFNIKHEFSSASIAENIESYLKLTEYTYLLTAVNLESQHSRETVSTIFDFPEEVKIPCEQYLLYFVEFLKDIGIEATSDLTEGAGRVLFSVAPADDSEALDKILEALAIYLNLPSSPIVYDDSFAAMRLQQQIENLQHSQKMAVRELQFTEKLLVAQSETIREKNVIISQKDSTIEQQNRIIEKITSRSIMMDSLEDKEEFEKIFDGLEVGESKWLKDNLGIKVNPVKSLKSLGDKLLRKDKEIVTLDLVEQEAKNDANN